MTLRLRSVAPLASCTPTSPRRVRRQQACRTLQVHDVHVVGLYVVLERSRELRALGLPDGDEVLDAHRVQYLAAEPLGDHSGADALASGVDGSRGPGGAPANDQHVEGPLVLQLRGAASFGLRVELREDLLDGHPPLGERLAVQVHGRHGHDFPRFDLGLEQGAVDHRAADARVQHGHQVQCLDDLGTVLAAEGYVGLELEVAVEAHNLLDHGCVDLRRVPAGVQKRQHQRRELMPHRDAGEANAGILANAIHAE